MRLEVASATSPHPREEENGDGVFFRSDAEITLFSVIDGLGHGSAAAEATAAALSALKTLDPTMPMDDVFTVLGGALRPTRGAAVLVVRFRGNRVDGASVGNVALRQVGAQVPIVLSPGIVGARVPRVRVFEGQVGVGTRLFAFSDGISAQFDHAEYHRLPRQDACNTILSRHRRERDDASILIADVED